MLSPTLKMTAVSKPSYYYNMFLFTDPYVTLFDNTLESASRWSNPCPNPMHMYVNPCVCRCTNPCPNPMWGVAYVRRLFGALTDIAAVTNRTLDPMWIDINGHLPPLPTGKTVLGWYGGCNHTNFGGQQVSMRCTCIRQIAAGQCAVYP